MRSKEILDNLHAFDLAISEKQLGFTYRIVLTGGSAILLQIGYNRETVDIDSLTRLVHLTDLAGVFGINDNAVAVTQTPPGYEARLRRLEEAFIAIDVWVLAPVDIILVKLQRYSEEDASDIARLLQVLSTQEIDLLIALGDHMADYMSFVFKTNWPYVRRTL